MAKLLCKSVPSESETIGGYEIHAGDTTAELRPDAKTLADRTPQKSDSNIASIPGHKYQWLGRLIRPQTSWFAPEAVERVKSNETPNDVAVRQIKALDEQNENPKVVVMDSAFSCKKILTAFIGQTKTFLLVRLRNNQKVYGEPPPRKEKQKGPPRIHGDKYALSKMPTADKCQEIRLNDQIVVLSAWHNVHLKQAAALVGMVVCVQFLKADRSPKYKRPLWLFWSGSLTTSLEDIARMYLWRFCIEHFFRFMKQHMGLGVYNGITNPELWMQVCMLSYWQLLLAANELQPETMPWYKGSGRSGPFSATPRQVQLSMGSYLSEIGTPAELPKACGKAPGRQKGTHPRPRTEYAVKYKTNPAIKKRSKKQKPAK